MDLIGALSSVNKVTATEGWDLANAVYNGTPMDVLAIPQDINDGFFKPDGTKLYTVSTGFNSSTGVVSEYDLATAWELGSASFVQNFAINSQETQGSGLFFKTDGTKMYVCGISGQDINEYSLSSAWDISTASYVQNFSVGSQDSQPTGIFFKDDGTQMFMVGESNANVYEYSLSSAWDISTLSYVRSFSLTTQDSEPSGIFFKPDGTKMYISGRNGNDILEYSLATAWNVSTTSYSQNYLVSTSLVPSTLLRGVFFKDDGTQMYVIRGGVNVTSFALSSAWDISTATFTYPTTNYFSLVAEETVPQDLFFKPDGTKMYVIGSTGDDVNEYDLSSAWDISTASYLQNFSVASQETVPTALFFKSDGTKMYVVGNLNDTVYEYDLSSAWDISTASYLQSFSVSTEETFPSGLFFKPDGTKMYVVGLTGDDVNEYDLSSAWDVSTASYLQNFSVASQDTTPTGLFFKPDGTKMYVIGFSDYVNEYNLSSAWNISTASYVQNFSVASQDGSPTGLFFRDDGTKMYVIGFANDAVWSYDL